MILTFFSCEGRPRFNGGGGGEPASGTSFTPELASRTQFSIGTGDFLVLMDQNLGRGGDGIWASNVIWGVFRSVHGPHPQSKQSPPPPSKLNSMGGDWLMGGGGVSSTVLFWSGVKVFATLLINNVFQN